MVRIPGRSFAMGTDEGPGYEGPVHEARVASFFLHRHEVTNEQFARFVAATRYETEAERFGASLVFEAGTWRVEEGADWRHPRGPHTSIEGRGREPVVQVSWNDARAYCRWEGGRLPTEAEWELAARGGLEGARYPWGDEMPAGAHLANTFQGDFPRRDSAADGFAERAPVGSFPPNGLGLHDMAGNVWEWTEDGFDPAGYGAGAAPEGGHKVMRGGSYLCAPTHCTGYRVAARGDAEPESAFEHVGFRCARSR